MLVDQSLHQSTGGQVALVRDFAADFRVLQIIEVVRIGIKNAVTTQPIRLMDLKLKPNADHDD
jgi:hypothetical protein